MRILLVEDDEQLVETTARAALARLGGGLQCAWRTGAALAAQRPYDILILDIGLPGIDGYETLRRACVPPRSACPCCC